MPDLVSPLTAQLTAILFVANEALSVARLAELTDTDIAAVETALKTLATELPPAGLGLAEHEATYRLTTAPAAHGVVRRYLGEEARAELSRPALETLAIVAYRGPLTKAELDRLRGVASDTMLRNLLSRGLIIETGRSQEPGRPQQYGVSHAFLQHFGLSSLQDLPPLASAATESTEA